MPEKDFDDKYGVDSTSPTSIHNKHEFHSNRRMFAIKENKLYLAPTNVSYSHARWFELEGWMTANDDSLINRIVRGYIDNNGIFFYKGYDFNVDESSKNEMLLHLDELVKTLSINNHTHLYGGKVKQNTPDKWPPREDYGSINNLLKNKI
jgi:hypothetical protein